MLVGREAESAAIDELLARVRAGSSGALALAGEAGIGKTSLLAYAQARADGFLVLRVLGVESEAELPYAALHQLLHPLLEGASLPAAVAAAFGGAGAPADRFAIGVAVLALLADAADAQPLLCVLDDAQWFDQESLAVLGFAARRLQQDGVALLFGARDPGLVPGVRELRVERLAPAAARSVLTGAFGAASDAVVASAEGNPLALLELGAREREGAGARSTVERSFLERISALPEPARGALLIAAAADGPDLATLAAAGVEAAALEPAELAGLVRVDAERVEFRHPLVRSAALAAASFHARQRAHRALADALEGDERRAWHLAAASVGADESVADELAAAAERARARGGDAAASLALERASERTDDPGRRRAWLVESAELAWSAGRFDRASALLDRAGAGDGAALAARAAGVRGAIALVRGDTAAALELHLGAIRPGSPAALGAARLALEAAALGGHFDRAAEIRDAARAAGDDPFVEGLAAMLLGDVAGAAPALARAIEAGRDSTDVRHLSAAAAAAAYLGRPQEASDRFAAAVAQTRAAGAAGVLALMLQYAAMIELWHGRPADAEADAQEALGLARETEQVAVEAVVLGILAGVAAIRGDEPAARARAAEALERALPRGIELATSAAGYALGLLELGLGDPAAAYDQLAGVAGRPGAHPIYRLIAVPDLAEAAARSGRVVDLREFDAWAQASGSPWTQALAARAHAVQDDDGARFEEALRLHDSIPSPLFRARTELLYGEHLRRRHRRREARTHLRYARHAFESLGAAPWAARAAAELRATGETIKQPAEHADELTPQELQVARLVGAGATNREVASQLFVSPKTVEYHLAKIFRKLGIASRAELVKLATTREAD